MRRVSRAAGKGCRRPIYSGNTELGRSLFRQVGCRGDGQSTGIRGGDLVVSCPYSGGLILPTGKRVQVCREALFCVDGEIIDPFVPFGPVP